MPLGGGGWMQCFLSSPPPLPSSLGVSEGWGVPPPPCIPLPPTDKGVGQVWGGVSPGFLLFFLRLVFLAGATPPQGVPASRPTHPCHVCVCPPRICFQ